MDGCQALMGITMPSMMEATGASQSPSEIGVRGPGGQTRTVAGVIKAMTWDMMHTRLAPLHHRLRLLEPTQIAQVQHQMVKVQEMAAQPMRTMDLQQTHYQRALDTMHKKRRLAGGENLAVRPAALQEAAPFCQTSRCSLGRKWKC